MAEEDRYGTVERSQTREETSSSRSVLPLLSDLSRPIHGEHAPLRSSGGNSQIGGENGDEGQRARRFEAFTRPRFASLTETLHLNISFTILMLVITLTLAVSMIFAIANSPNYVSELHRKTGPTEYDFIIVGAGPAGSMLARRLSDDLEKRVLLLEAGMPSQFKLGGEDFLSNPLTPFDIPLMWPSVSDMKDFHWLVKDNTKTDSATGEHPNTLVAKALGGCGIHNAMLYVRALESDFVKWDVEGFDYASAVETWKELENYTRPGPLPDWHLRGGPISVSPPQFVDEVAPFFLDSCAQIGIPTVEDFNKPGGREGAGYYDFTIRSGVRDSVASAMLGDIIMGKDERTNLDILSGALVTRVLFNSSGPSVLLGEDSPEPPSRMEMEGEKEAGVHHIPSATGVEFILDGKLQEAWIKEREKGPAIVVTAGALHTPKVLMASGIGNKTELASNKIKCVADVPGVGKNLQDHASVGVMYMLGPDLLKLTPSAYTVAQELEKYKNQVLKAFDLDLPLGTTEGGVDHDSHADRENSAPSLFSSAGLSVGAFLRSPYESNPAVGNLSEPAPDIQLTVFPRVTEPHILALADTRPAAHAPPMMLVTVSILDPQGRSAVRLQPNNPLLGSPEIHVDDREGAPEPMTELDVEKLAWGVGQVRKIMNTPPLRELTMGEVYPGPGVSGIPGDTAGEDDCLLDWVSSHAYSNSHWCGTARMGNVSSNPEIVVDERMAVRGVKRLYIGDASVIPYIPNGNVHSTVVLVATRLAEYLQADTL